MNLKAPLVLFLCLSLLSCKDKKAENLRSMEASLRQYFDDLAFKNNAEVKVYELTSISYDTISENSLDTQRLIKANEKYEHFNSLYQSSLDIAKLEADQLRLYAVIGSKTLMDIKKDAAKKSLKEAQEYADSMMLYVKIDSSIRDRITKRKTPEIMFKFKTFIKLTYSKDSLKENILDTSYFYFTKNLTIIDLSELDIK